ncbi:MAG: biotin--[acetyl-CoA-carboxylase] ligase [Deltaproteobacteria bacterium]|nr:biotin--[acetyl-CoA-carboxylase] ligase [Deltaproteobacteria bacterium]MBW2658236.1 biotin--[acetyl-CoA-carboxylase] ligase [Deltaproteobacteria bacterium]
MALNNPSPLDVSRHLQCQMAGAGGFHDKEIVLRYGAFVGSKIESHTHLQRAMGRARTRIEMSAASGSSIASGTVILADTMSHSRGRFSREWHAPPGGVWGCMIHANTLLPGSRNLVPLAVGVACCEAVRETGGRGAVLRWVNDLLLEGKKLAGFLVETYTESHFKEEYNLVGFGININNRNFPEELSGSAVSLAEVLGYSVDPASFTALFLARLAWNFGLLYYEESCDLRGDGFSGEAGEHLLLREWRQLSDTIGQRVQYGFDVMTSPQYEADVLGIDGRGGLHLRLDDGLEKVEYSGEVRYL